MYLIDNLGKLNGKGGYKPAFDLSSKQLHFYCKKGAEIHKDPQWFFWHQNANRMVCLTNHPEQTVMDFMIDFKKERKNAAQQLSQEESAQKMEQDKQSRKIDVIFLN